MAGLVHAATLARPSRVGVHPSLALSLILMPSQNRPSVQAVRADGDDLEGEDMLVIAWSARITGGR
ncbi:hypothetical protein [Streptomyces sp. NPDC056549]|uniref:hypothetical protein n=1 Tax=Streptomyces sp. NPDC056549 TaxID=3345864 RepID=UPI00369558DB